MNKYQEIYRGIGFHLTGKGYWFFDEIPPRHPYRWSAYVTEDDDKSLDVQVMRH